MPIRWPLGPRQGLQVLAALILCWIAWTNARAILAVWQADTPDKVETALSLAFPRMHGFADASLVLLLSGLMFRRQSAVVLAVALILAGWSGSSHLVDGPLHVFLTSHQLHPLQPFGWKDFEINNQWTRIALWVPAAGLYFARICDRRFRSIDRIFTLVIALSIPVTGLVFHRAVAKGIHDPGIYAVQLDVSAAISGGPDVLEAMCRSWNADCFRREASGFQDWSEVEVLTGNPGQDGDVRRWFGSVEGALTGKDHAGHVGFISETISAASLSFRYAVLAYRRDGDRVLGAVVRDPVDVVIHRAQAWFCCLALVAWSVWVFGGFGLLFWHRRRLRERVVKIR